jgi:hypothetical protein
MKWPHGMAEYPWIKWMREMEWPNLAKEFAKFGTMLPFFISYLAKEMDGSQLYWCLVADEVD